MLAGLIASALLAGSRQAKADPSSAEKNAKPSAVTSRDVPEDVAAAATATISGGTDLYGDPLPAGTIARLGTLRYRAAQGELLHEIAFSAGNWTIVGRTKDFGRDRGSFCWWDPANGKLLRRVRLGEVLDTDDGTITPDGRIAVTLGGMFIPQPSGGGAAPQFWLKWWEVDSGKKLASISCDDCNSAIYLAISRDGATVVAGDRNRPGMVRVWNGTAQRLTATYEAKDGIEDVAISPSGKALTFVTQREGVRLWDFRSMQDPRTVFAPPRTFCHPR